MPAGHGFGLGFAVRTHSGIAPFPGSPGQFFWSGMAGTFFWIDPVEDLFAVFMMQGPGQRQYIRTLLRNLVTPRWSDVSRSGRDAARSDASLSRDLVSLDTA